MTNDGYQQPPQGYPGAHGPGAAPPPAQPQPGMPGSFPPEDVEGGKIWAILGYIISPLWIIPLVQRDNAFALFHAKQAMTYTIVMVVASIPITTVGVLTCGVGSLLIVPLLYPWIMAIVYSSQGQYRPMPWFGHWSEQWFHAIQADKRPGGSYRTGAYR